MWQLKWYVCLCSTLSLQPSALSFGSATDRRLSTDEVRVTALSRGSSHRFVLPLPIAAAGDLKASPRDLVRVSSSNAEVASASVSAVLDRRRLLLKSGPVSGLLQCEVSSLCHSPGHARFRLDFAPLSERIGMAPMFLAKTCYADVLPGFNVGEEPQGTDVVKNGEPQWTRQHELELPYNRNEVNLYISMADSATSQPFAFPIVRTTAVDWGLPGEPLQATGVARGADVGAGSIVQVQVLSNLDKGSVSRDSPKSLRLAFQCFKAGTARVELVLSPKAAWEPYRPLSLWLTKRCGGGFRKGFEVGSDAATNDLVLDGVVKRHPSDVSGLTGTTSFYVRYAPSGPRDPDQHPKPAVQCVGSSSGRHDAASTMNAGVKVVATADGGSRYDVEYSCVDRADFECTLRLGLELWKSPQLKWKKSCGGAARPDMVVESSLARYATVFVGGRPAAEWLLENPQVTLLPEEADVSFTVHHKADLHGSEAMVLSIPQVQSSDTSILEANATNAASVSGRRLGGDKDGATLLVQHTCKSPGRARVTVLIPTVDGNGGPQGDLNMFGPVSFSYYKSCAGSGCVPFSAPLGMLGLLCVSSVAAAGCMTLRPAEQPKERPEPPLGRAYL